MSKLGMVFLIPMLTLPFRLEAEQQGCDEVLARILSVQGIVEKKQMEAHEWIRIENGSLLCANETIRTLKKSRATVEVINETIVSLDESTTLLFSKEEDDSLYAWLVDLFTGKIFLRSRDPHRLKVNTPFINAAHEGTEFMVSAEADHGEVWVFDGKVSANNEFGKVTVEKGQKAVAFKGHAPQIKPIKISPEDAVQWLLYYPPILEDQTPGQEPLDANSADFYNQQASSLLSLGRVEEAQTALNKAKSLEPENANSLALEAVMAVAKNRSDQALELSSRAVKKDPQSAAARIAHSYALQSKFLLEEALETMEQAVKREPSHAIAWARLAELQLSMGDQDSALESAQTAEKLDPTFARTQIILGFADLAQVDIEEAKQAFEQAIQLDSTDPLARLGLGLAKIRRGDVEEGTRDIEAAVSLDPDNAVMRSYLGKAYYELKNTSYATIELAIAKEKDPKDPTPWFYDAILKQTTNRPVEALHDMQKAIELNDNRAVYRSSLLLDEDLAARSASLGRIYNDLGFQQRGLLEGWKSVSTVPSNYSAHRLLADNYASRPRHEIARVSELFQSQLLQPININPIQPSLAESNLLILNGSGPSNTSFNEFNPLFTRNRLALQTSGIYGSNNTWGEEIVQSGLWDNFSYSLGQFHHETDGFRENNDVKRDIYNFFVQGSLTSYINIQGEYRSREGDQGDVHQYFDGDKAKKKKRRKKDQDTARIGLSFFLSPNSTFIVSGLHTDIWAETTTAFDESLVDSPLVKIKENLEGYQLESQYLFQNNLFNVRAGFGLYSVKGSGLTVIPGQNIPPSNFKNSNDNIYIYTNVLPLKDMIWTFGLSYDSLQVSPFPRFQKFNPKFGLQWQLLKNLRIRAGYFEYVKRHVAVDQTIEPTQIAGFNQFFDDVNGTKAKRYGLGLDANFTNKLSGGFEYSERKLKFDISLFQDQKVIRKTNNRSEELARFYLYWTPHPYWAISVEAELERFNRSLTDTFVNSENQPYDISTFYLPLGVRYFNPSGFFAGLGGTFVHQEVDYLNPPKINPSQSGTHEFFLVDAKIGYRFYGRRGLVSLEGKNLFNTKFKFEDTAIQTQSEEDNPRFIPGVAVYFNLTLAF